ncbi:MAG: tetratricopeptide repeat protein, partial [Planctomycetota bacterium]
MSRRVAIAVAVVVVAVVVVVVVALLRPGGGGTSGEPDAADLEANRRGVGLMGRFDYEPARRAFATLVDEHPEWLDVRVNLAIATLNRQQEGDSEAALALLQAVLAEDPSHLRANYCAGLLQLYLGQPAEALTHFRLVADA